ncbi:MAG: hypothetical protein GY945_02230 [Rhodobacteraceae bacterium]|nr:hypothetical protein [Paracoccaceae bacterium]
MTALSKYERLESPGLWRASKDAQRRDVIVSLGEATLTISDTSERALAHWSLPAIIRLNPGETPALYAPAQESAEDLELDDQVLIGALEKVHKIIEKRRPHKGRLRHALTGGFLIAITAIAVFWLPDALMSYTVNVVPDATRRALGEKLEARIYQITGRACNEALGRAALATLGHTLLGENGPRIVVLAKATRPALHLPGRIILISSDLIEGKDTPFVLAGYILAEDERARQTDPMLALLDHAGMIATVKLLATGSLSEIVLDSYGERLLTSAQPPLPDPALLARFAAANLPASPYAFALDPSGEGTLALIEADPVAASDAVSPLSDDNWISLQGICSD